MYSVGVLNQFEFKVNRRGGVFFFFIWYYMCKHIIRTLARDANHGLVFFMYYIYIYMYNVHNSKT